MARHLILAAHLLDLTFAWPDPFSRELRVAVPPLAGPDVDILQNLLLRAGNCSGHHDGVFTGAFDGDTARAVACFQQRTGGVPSGGSPGVVGNATAWRVLQVLSLDGYRDDGRSAAALGGYAYKLLIPVHVNRSVETVATLLDAHNTVLLTFPVRTHGHDVGEDGQPVMGIPWPDFSDDGCPNATKRQGCVGLNEFSRYGGTPTGLVELDLNAPEGEPSLYGPYPVNRFVQGKAGNAGFLVPSLRNGILVHTGEPEGEG
jgi:hypothetical protein